MNHAVVPGQLFAESDLTDFFSVININFAASVTLTYHLLPLLQKSKGKLVTIGSGGQFMPPAFLNAYITSKSALMAFIEGMQIEQKLINSHVHFEYIVLGTVKTEQLLSQGVADALAHSESHDVPFTITPEQSAADIKCCIDRNLEYAFSPPSIYFTSWFTYMARPFWVDFNNLGWLAGKPDFSERIQAQKNVLARQARLE